MSYREQVHGRKLTEVAERLRQGQTLGLVSDAGTPGVSDPGSWLVRDLLKLVPDIEVVPVPGPSAAVAALSVAGFPCERFVFFGFPPHRKGRSAFFREMCGQPLTAVFYESPHRIEKALTEIDSLCPERQLCLGRELTKMHETIYRGRPAEVLADLRADSVKGEFVGILAADKSRKTK
jgi:16S rRNA (cytidine1402-2'-O)-methyltransferase